MMRMGIGGVALALGISAASAQTVQERLND